jgi:DNA replication protein DnaC
MDGNGLVTAEVAKVAGLAFEEPERIACPHCGKALDALGAPLAGRVVWVAHAECGCDGAASDREERKRAEAERSAEAARRDDLDRYLRSGAPKRYYGAQVDIDAVFRYIRGFQGSKGAGLYIQGAVGRGKTYAASAIAHEFLRSGYNVVFATSKGMLEAVKATFDGGGSAKDAIARYAKCDLLVLDDLGKEDATEWSVSTVFSVLNTRYEDMRPTIITSNYRLDELARRVGRRGESVTAAAIASRVAQTCAVVALGGSDRRAVP